MTECIFGRLKGGCFILQGKHALHNLIHCLLERHFETINPSQFLYSIFMDHYFSFKKEYLGTRP